MTGVLGAQKETGCLSHGRMNYNMRYNYLIGFLILDLENIITLTVAFQATCILMWEEH